MRPTRTKREPKEAKRVPREPQRPPRAPKRPIYKPVLAREREALFSDGRCILIFLRSIGGSLRGDGLGVGLEWRLADDGKRLLSVGRCILIVIAKQREGV